MVIVVLQYNLKKKKKKQLLVVLALWAVAKMTRNQLICFSSKTSSLFADHS